MPRGWPQGKAFAGSGEGWQEVGCNHLPWMPARTPGADDTHDFFKANTTVNTTHPGLLQVLAGHFWPPEKQ